MCGRNQNRAAVSKSEYARRYAVFILGLYILGLGIAMIIHTGIGTSPTSSWAYVMSLNTPWSVGTYSFIINLVFIALQCLVLYNHGLRKEAVNILLQLPFSWLFGMFIDINLVWVSRIPLTNYAEQFLFMLLGIVVQAVGVLLEVRPGVSMLSMEALLNYVSIRWNLNFGKLKIWCDCSIVALGLIFAIGFALWKDGDVLEAIFTAAREGTVITAVLCGWLVARWSHLTDRLERWMKEGK